MAERTQEWSERVGREAVGLGFQMRAGMAWASLENGCGRLLSTTPPFEADCWFPDFRDRLTELACIAWVEDVAREVYGDVCLGLFRNEDGRWWVKIESPINPKRRIHLDADTLAEACIAAVRAMRETQC